MECEGFCNCIVTGNENKAFVKGMYYNNSINNLYSTGGSILEVLGNVYENKSMANKIIKDIKRIEKIITIIPIYKRYCKKLNG